jgi:hypothetical protein
LLPDIAVATPAAYAVPAQWTKIIARLKAHGIVYRRLDCPVPVEAMGYQLANPKWSSQPFESHLMLRDVQSQRAPRQEVLPPGSVIVPMDQPSANLVIELLEPDAPDSLLRWGLLDAIFETKEYGEPRVLEKLARDILAKDPALKAEFERKLKSDPAFAADPRARLSFFFQRSPWFAAQKVGAYPVLRLDAAALRALPAEGSGTCPMPKIDAEYTQRR